jgi:hypothetical protein
VRGLDGGVDHGQQVGPDRVEVDGVAEPGGEGGDHLVGVVADPVEPAVHGVLDPPAQRGEQRGGREGGRGHRDR